MKLTRFATAFALLASLAVTSSPSYAKTWSQNHPRRAQVAGRDAHLNSKINRDYGHLGGHYWQLEHRDNAIRNQANREARANGGYLTSSEQHQLNREENGLNRQIRRDYAQGRPGDQFADNHPRRAEVLGRDARLGQRIAADRGQLDGHYGQLQQEDNAIRNQEQQDAHANGGYITRAQQQQLNQEENQLRQQIHQDH